ncbi:MAG: cell division protein ZapA [Methyloprofundus sp.]|nr:cell division protein ZapA [Methyloprofundus sp.]MDT8426670.1 cell division protein ZapA [Methyloprofundus sp.]
MSKKEAPVSLIILGKEYKIMCAAEEQEDLIDSAHQLDEQMRKIRLTGKVSGAERTAVLAALNLTHELMQAKKNAIPDGSGISKQLNKMYLKIETALKNV